MGNPTALDLFCGAGGAAMGLIRAGYDVTGVDIEPQPDYPGMFVQADALDCGLNLAEFDFIWASPPCLAYSWSLVYKPDVAANHPALIEPTRALLAGHSYSCIENVQGAPLRPDLVLTMPQFGYYTTMRKRIFEVSFAIMAPPRQSMPPALVTPAGNSGVPDKAMQARRIAAGLPRTTAGLPELEDALGVYHIQSGTQKQRRKALNNAIPPIYAEYIGGAAMRLMRREREV